jgi:hypothetical protein
MSTITTKAHSIDMLHPLVAALTGAAIFALTMTAGDVFGLSSDTGGGPATSAGEIAAYVGLVAAAILIATWLGLRARAGSPRRLPATALGLAIAAAVMFLAFWSGWPQVFGAVAVVLAVEHRRRIGSFSVTTLSALALGAVAVIASATVCVLG